MEVGGCRGGGILLVRVVIVFRAFLRVVGVERS